MTTTLRSTRVGIDPTSHEDVFAATVVDGQHWNGWACPSFAPAEARRVAAWINRNHLQEGYSDAVTLVSISDDDRFATWVDIDGEDVYVSVLEDEGNGFGLGSFGWCWSECDDLPTEPAEIDAALVAQGAATVVYCETWNTALRAAYAEGSDASGAYAAAQAAVEAAGLV